MHLPLPLGRHHHRPHPLVVTTVGNPGLAGLWGPSRAGLGLPSWCSCSSGSPSPDSCPLPGLRCVKGWIQAWPEMSRSSCSAQWICCSASLAPLHPALALLFWSRGLCPCLVTSALLCVRGHPLTPADQSPAHSPSHRPQRRCLWPLWIPFS